MRSKALVKSTKRIRIKLFEFSEALKIPCVNLTSAWVVDLFVVQRNWLESKCVSKYSLNHRATNFSAILAIILVIAIGLMSCSTVLGGYCFGRGVIREIFQESGTIPYLTEELIIAQIGSARINESSLRTLFGIRSGPDDFCNETLVKAVNTSIGSTIYFSGTAQNFCLNSASFERSSDGKPSPTEIKKLFSTSVRQVADIVFSFIVILSNVQSVLLFSLEIVLRFFHHLAGLSVFRCSIRSK